MLTQAFDIASQRYLVTFGIPPEYPETGYGYIHSGAAFSASACHVKAFVEKPDKVTAQAYIDDGNYFWNAGIFVFSLPLLLTYFETFVPELCSVFYQAKKRYGHWASPDLIGHVYKEIEGISIDYAILEKAARVVVLPADIGWNDLGSWTSVYNCAEKDPQGNVIRGSVMTEKTKNALIYASDKKVAVVGMEDVVVVESKDAILICHKENAQNIKQLVEQLDDSYK